METKFLESYELYADAIFRHCLFKGATREQAKDFTQETFMKVWNYLKEGKEVQNMKAFLYRVAGNLIIDESRKKKAESLDKMMEESPNYEPSDDNQKTLEELALKKQVLETIEKLEPEDREILTYRFIDDLEPKEIAEILHISANYVSVKITRAAKELEKKLMYGN